MRLIALRDAVKSYGSRTVLRGLDLEVDERARIGVIGQNGSGTVSYTHLTLPTICSV